MMVPICLSYIGQYLMCQHEWQYPHAALRALAALMKVCFLLDCFVPWLINLSLRPMGVSHHPHAWILLCT